MHERDDISDVNFLDADLRDHDVDNILSKRKETLIRLHKIQRRWAKKVHAVSMLFGFDGLATLYLYLIDGVRGRVFSPPGSFARRALAFLFSKKAFDSVFAQAIIDMREEHAEALAKQDLWKARWIVTRDHLGLGLTVGTYLAANAGKKLLGIWKMIP